MNNLSNMHGGYIPSSYVNTIIRELTEKDKVTPELKRRINDSITNSAHGSFFLGTASSYKGGDRNIRMLIGAHFSENKTLKVGTFGGRCERGETTIDTVIRETIEEIFNFEPIPRMIEEIRNFLNHNTHLYYIFRPSREHEEVYSYIFDVSILGDFIRIISNMGIYNIPRELRNGTIADRNIAEYYVHNTEFSDLSSFNGANQTVGTGSTISLSEFLGDRYISRGRARRERRAGLNEIQYLSFAALHNLVVAARTTGRYAVYSFVNERREVLVMKDFLRNVLLTDIIEDILRYSII